MKQFIVMSAMIMLGAFIYNMIAGGGDGTIMSGLSEFWKNEIALGAGTH